MPSLTFNGIKKNWLITKPGRKKSPFAPITRNVLTVPGMPGGYLESSTTEVLEIEQPIGIEIRDNQDALRIKDEMAEWLLTDNPVSLEFDNEPGRTYFAVIQNGIDDFDEFSTLKQGTLNFLCIDPYSYGPEQAGLFPSDIVNVQNDGTSETYPTFNLSVREAVTFAMVQNQNEEYMLIGKPVDEDGHEKTVNTRVSVLYENGNTLDTWSPTKSATDDYFIDISGSMMTDDAGIRTQSYGTGDRMHGPAIMKELPETLQNFEIESTFDIISQRPEENFRMEIYFHDENMKMLGKLGVKDDNRSYLRRRGLGRVGTYRGNGVGNGYAIGEQNYSFDNVQETTLMYLRVKREGTKYTFYIAQWRNRKHIRNISAVYNDVKKEFQGKLRYITLFIGKYQDRPNPLRLRINSVEVFKLQQVNEDSTPYILYPGDEVEFNHKEEEILVNGEDRTDLKDFGASYFPLAKGENQLVVHPPNSFQIGVIYRNRYK